MDEREKVLEEISEALKRLEGTGFAKLIPEVGSNLAYALPGAEEKTEVAAVPGRIRNASWKPVFMVPAFGASSHMAALVLAAMEKDGKRRCAMNIRYSEDIVKALEAMGLAVVFVDRAKEPRKISDEEGKSISWVFSEACRKAGGVPDVIYHKGAVGREAMVQLLGKTPREVVNLALDLADRV